MTDIFAAQKRIWIMSRIRGKHTCIENRMQIPLESNRIKFKQHPGIHGTPDFLVGRRTAVFCDGDF